MKKLFAIAVLGLALASCKKSSSGASSSAQLKLNDTAYNFSVLSYAEAYNGGKEIYFEAYSNSDVTKSHYIDFRLESNLAITPGVYSDTSTYPSLPTVYKALDYFEYDPTYYTIPGTISYFETAGLVTKPFTVTITSITQTSIQATVNGTIYAYSDSSTTPGNFKVVTGNINSTLEQEN